MGSSYYSIGAKSMLPKEEMLETGRVRKILSIGIPKEKLKNENRVSITPQGVELLVSNGHKVIFESKAGDSSSYHDKEYIEAGAQMTTRDKDIYQADIVVKITPPTPDEIELFNADQLLLSLFFPLVQSSDKIKALLDKRISAIGYEFLQDENNCTPVIRSMNEIEGSTAIMIIGEYLSNAHNGKGVLMGGITGISPAEIVIIGAGTAGEFAARAAIGLGATVKVFDESYRNLREIEHNLGQRVFTSVLQPQALTKALKSADAVIACTGYFGKSFTYTVTEEQVAQMKPGSVIVDLCMAQGGVFESSRCTNLDHPVFIKHEVIHYCVPNISSRVSRTASIALSNILAPLILKLSDSGSISNLIKDNQGVGSGTYIFKGILTNREVGNQFNLPNKDINLLMAAF